MQGGRGSLSRNESCPYWISAPSHYLSKPVLLPLLNPGQSSSAPPILSPYLWYDASPAKHNPHVPVHPPKHVPAREHVVPPTFVLIPNSSFENPPKTSHIRVETFHYTLPVSFDVSLPPLLQT